MLDEVLVFSYSGIVIYSRRFLEEEDEGFGERVERGRMRVNVNPIDEVIKLVLLEGKGSSGKYDTEKHRWGNEEEECKCFFVCFVPRLCCSAMSLLVYLLCSVPSFEVVDRTGIALLRFGIVCLCLFFFILLFVSLTR